jgi:hypothetical protein
LEELDGKMISGFLYRPPAKFSGKRAVIVEIHGGAGVQDRPDFLGRDNYFLSELGIALIFPNVGARPATEKHFSHPTTDTSAKVLTRTSILCSIGSRASQVWMPTK